MDEAAGSVRCGRGRFLTLAALGGAIAGSVSLDRALAHSGPSAAQDREIFGFALHLEQLKSSFYAEALSSGRLSGELGGFAKVAAAHERAHVRFLERALGRHARPAPSFRFGAATQHPAAFMEAAIRLEDLAVAAYNGQAGNLTRKGLGAAIKIVSVEGRHSAWIRAIAAREPAPRAADPGEGAAAVTAALRRLHIR